MNIFMLDRDPIKAAQMQCDKHVVKMILESAQMLSTAHRVLDGREYIDSSSGRKVKRWGLKDSREKVLYKATHVNHPSNIWVREDLYNYIWLYDHFEALSTEYEYRYGKVHATWDKLGRELGYQPDNIHEVSMTNLPLAMPENFRSVDPVKSYRSYYQSKKSNFKMVWTKRNAPEWFKI